MLWEQAESRSTESVTRHLNACARCSARVEQYRRLLEKLRGPGLSAPPKPWITEAQARIRKVSGAGTRAPGGSGERIEKLRRTLEGLRARLVLDSSAGVALAGIRSAGTLPSRTILFESDLGEVYLKLEPSSRGVDVTGQMAAAGDVPWEKARVHVEVGERRATRRVSPAGTFRFRSLPPGKTRFVIEMEERFLELDDVQT